MQDIHDIKPPIPVDIESDIFTFIIALVVVLFSLITGYFLFRYIKKRLNKKRDRNGMLLSSPSPANEAALKELATISDLMMTEPRLYYFRLTAVVKHFIGKVFCINAPEMTTQEIIVLINTLAIEKTIVEPLKEFFLSSSMVKYAAVIPQIEQMRSDEQFIKKFIYSVAKSSAMSKESQEHTNLADSFSTGG